MMENCSSDCVLAPFAEFEHPPYGTRCTQNAKLQAVKPTSTRDDVAPL